MHLKRQLFCALAALCLILLCEDSLAEVAAVNEHAINNLYDSLLQREYAGPVVFPNHQVERKAQRSPSLRLRFGRRSDPEMQLMPSAEKRWFGDVNQKPIRSPSLRLRFGRRSDPSMPLHSSFDALMNDLDSDTLAEQDYNDAYEGYERVVRKPQRLRWGRSVPFEGGANDLNEEENEREQQQRQRSDDLLNSLMSSEKLRNMLLTMRQFDAENAAASNADSDEFEREVRKPAPLRLRWGRSTGGRNTVAVAGTNLAEQKKSLSQNAKTVEKTPTQQEQDKE